jgi:LacI family transcriptional regulator
MNEDIKRVTRKDVAQKAGVTPTIVSYVINENRYVDDAKKERVLAAIKELGYRPNSLARALKGKQSNHILFIVDDLLSNHFAKIIKQMDSWAYERGSFISLCESQNSEEFVSQIYQRYFDAVIIASGTLRQKYIQQFIDTGIPVVLLEMRNYSKLKGDFALINSGLYEGAKLCTRTLLEKGRRHLVYVHSKLVENNEIFLEEDFRYHGFKDAMKEAALDSFRIIEGYHDQNELEKEIKALLESGFPIDGIFGRTDAVAIPAMHILQKLGYDLPSDCSVIGVDNSELCNYMQPSLSSLEINRSEIGEATKHLLDKLFEHQKLGKDELRINIKSELVKRESL